MPDNITFSIRVVGAPTETERGGPLLPPLKNAYATITITATLSNGQPAQGVRVKAQAVPETLTNIKWRDINMLANRWPLKSGNTLRARYKQEHLRLKATFDRTELKTNALGKAEFKVKAWHVCGNGVMPAKDKLSFSHDDDLVAVGRVRCGIEGLVKITNNASIGVVTKNNIRAAYVKNEVDRALQEIGRKWKQASANVSSVQKEIVVTDGSLRWGGLVPPHLTHRFGGAVDVRAVSTDGNPTSIGKHNYSKEGTATLIRLMANSEATRIVFGEALPGVTYVDNKHKRHIHVSWLNDPKEPWL